MQFDAGSLKKILLTSGYVSEKDVAEAERLAVTRRTSFLDELLNEGYISPDILGQAAAEYFAVPYADLNSHQPSKEQVLKIPEAMAKEWRIVVFEEKKTSVVVTTDDPAKKGLKEILKSLFPTGKVAVAYSLPEDIDVAITQYRQTLETRFATIMKEGNRVAPELLDILFTDAIDLRTSDIHFEPSEEDVLVRFRVDGVLRDVAHLPKEQYENILNRIKVQSGIRLDEHFSAQDGSMQFRKDAFTVDLRTSIVPTVEGEKVVLRVLGSYVQGLGLSEIGFSKQHQEMIQAAADKPFGMILVAGPTGSGKTTTLYALLKVLNQSDVNITTIEDPVEYKMKGVNQIQVNTATNLSFANGLRSIVRQDPDVILVGEIRDEETAEIAVNAALTGHLLLSTFHANDAATAIPRLIDMAIEPFLLASTIELVVAQRLVRKICDHCRMSVSMKGTDITKGRADLKQYFPGPKYTVYQGKGCEICGHSGFHGRTALFELIQITPELQNIILKNPSAQELWKLARSQGARTMFEDGIEKVKSGVTTMDELMRVAEPPKDIAV
ncbi:Flp pilus assembly complex ATPase component TadA [Patescibacteria group bacterium]|nr:Flp pilus assembly complex ATPase component TadA [Patescibacteria group bacterium]